MKQNAAKASAASSSCAPKTAVRMRHWLAMSTRIPSKKPMDIGVCDLRKMYVPPNMIPSKISPVQTAANASASSEPLLRLASTLPTMNTTSVSTASAILEGQEVGSCCRRIALSPTAEDMFSAPSQPSRILQNRSPVPRCITLLGSVLISCSRPSRTMTTYQA
eukprot:scaffold442_cov268-Pinguiococcus_pyrenoidosus.AAC.70